MKTLEKIISKQVEWANNQGIKLIGSHGAKGRKVYTATLDDNLFQTLNTETRKELIKGDGSELKVLGNRPSKIQALHSSSAIGINIFDYWRCNRSDISVILSACGFIRANSTMAGRIQFEQKFPIDDRFQYSPNLDVGIYPDKPQKYKIYGIECKFTEPYSSRGHGGLDKKYLENQEIWKNLIETKKIASQISPNDTKFSYLHAAQLIKHILGLNRKFGHGRYRLLYLWYDASGELGWKHKQEIEQFTGIVRSDGVVFHDITHQELIINLAKHRKEHEEYIKYITGRYL